ncbi:hypothetical protein L1987_58994 [Smallanthus sonchifolius]|uniref:Uncharacterized protein n=1 Tax=Smallanthus sonchifolius TaxID=185202 RepID=A0ACB9D401_9ASTR|nr:hypothetical protein L1987_58994 [Smallanthus sonchifolius]
MQKSQRFFTQTQILQVMVMNVSSRRTCVSSINLHGTSSLSHLLLHSTSMLIVFLDKFSKFDETEVYYNVNLAGNGSSIDLVKDFESLDLGKINLGDSMVSKTLRLGENDNINGRDNDNDESLGFKEEGGTSEIQEEIKFSKRDEKGWECGSVVKNGNQAVWTTKKKPGPAQARRAKKRPTSNPHEFYYYSGFGPSWGKKRGTTTTSVGSNSNTGHQTSSINSDMDVQEETRNRFKPDTSKVGLDYLDDHDEDEEDDREIGKVEIIGKKRGRKPIKERSLKSLM